MPFDFDTPIDRHGTWSMRWDRYPRGVIPLSVADTDFRIPPAVEAAMQRRLRHGVLGYSSPPPELREAVAERMQRLYRWKVEPGWVEIIPGVVPGLHLPARYLMRADQNALVPAPVYHHFKRALGRAGRAHSDAPLVLRGGRWVFDEERLAAALRPETRLLFQCNLQNPGGTIFRADELRRFGELALRHDLIICSDEIHADLLLDEGKPHVPIASLSPEICRRTVTLISPNKAFNFPGAGLGFAIIEDPEQVGA